MEDYDFYPPKPELVEPKMKSSLAVTIFSIVLFVLVFLLFFANEINFIIYLIVVLLIHELGHFLAMKIFGYENVRMLFIPLMGAFVQGKKQEYSQRQSFIVALAGPVPGLIIGTSILYIGLSFHSYWMVELAALFLLLNIVNLFPLDPLDGGQLFKLLVRKRTEIFLMVFALLSSLLIIGLGWLMDSTIIMLFGFFMSFRVRALQKQHQIHREFSEEDINYEVSYRLLSNRDFLKIKQILLDSTPPLRTYIEQVGEEESNPILASQVNNVLKTPINKDAGLVFKISVLLIWLSAFVLPVVLYYTINFNWLLSFLYLEQP